ncbi:hypothetical protein BX604_7318 [Burkholderia sp. JKS000303]|nr:hypothetical protein BX604_7318 [Burkholderia sp. JKS000303]
MKCYVVSRTDPALAYEVVDWNKETQVAVLRGRYSTFTNIGFDPAKLKADWYLTADAPEFLKGN